jgi:hypothetical protein
MVRNDADESPVVCGFILLGAAPTPLIEVGDTVLYLEAADGEAYVLGVVRKYSLEPPTPGRLQMAAAESIELRCGKGLIKMTRDGRVVVKGSEIVSRASGVHKIKGAAIKLN